MKKYWVILRVMVNNMGGVQKKSKADKLMARLQKIKGKEPKKEEVDVRKKVDDMYADAKEAENASERSRKLIQAGIEYKKMGLDKEAEKVCNEAVISSTEIEGEEYDEVLSKIVDMMTINQIALTVETKEKLERPERPKVILDKGADEDEITSVHEKEVEEETKEAGYEDETRTPGEELRPVSESQIEDEEELTEEAEIMEEDDKEDAKTEIHEEMQELPYDGEVVLKFVDGKVVLAEEEEGEATQIYMEGLEEGEATKEGFREKSVTNKDLLNLLKGVDKIIGSLKREVEMLEGEKDVLEEKTKAMEEVLDQDVSTLQGKTANTDKAVQAIEEVVDDDNLKALVKMHVGEELGEMEDKKTPEVSEQLVDGILELKNEVLGALVLAPEEGAENEKYLDALEKCEDKYGEEKVLSVIKSIPELDETLEEHMGKAAAEIVRERAEFILENMGDE